MGVLEQKRRWQFRLASLFVAMLAFGVCLTVLRFLAVTMGITGWYLGAAGLAAAVVGWSGYAAWRRFPDTRVPVGVSLRQAVLSLYLPFGWLVLIDYPWSDYHWFWVRLWPILPGFVPGALLFHPHDLLEFSTMATVTLLLLFGLTWLGTRGRRRLLLATLAALLVSVPTAFVTYGVYWM